MYLLCFDKILWLIMANESDHICIMWSPWSFKLTREVSSNKYKVQSLKYTFGIKLNTLLYLYAKLYQFGVINLQHTAQNVYFHSAAYFCMYHSLIRCNNARVEQRFRSRHYRKSSRRFRNHFTLPVWTSALRVKWITSKCSLRAVNNQKTDCQTQGVRMV